MSDDTPQELQGMGLHPMKVPMTEEKAKELFKQYLDSHYTSLNAFGIHKAGISRAALSRHFIEFVDGYEALSTQGFPIKKDQLYEL